ncbi:MAG: C25 family cysteine peptidase [Acidobacteriota bacterium]
MKKVVTAVVLFTLWVTPALTVSAQKTRSPRQTVKETPAPAPAPTGSVFGSVEAYTDGKSVLARWTMTQEAKNLGFDVYRIDSKGEHRVTADLVLGAATRLHAANVQGESYEFFDADNGGDGVYIVEAVGLNGERTRASGVVPTPISNLGLVSRQTRTNTNAGSVEARSLSLPKDLSSEVDANTAEPNPTVHRSVISRPGVKLGVKGEGLFRVTRVELLTGGFDVNGDSSLWQLYVNGNEQAMIIGPNGDYIEFYGKGVDTVESDIQTYYLITGDAPGKRIASRATRLGTSTVVAATYPETVVRKERTNYLNQVFNEEAGNYFGRVITGMQTTYPLILTGVDPNGPDVTITLSLLGFSADAHQMEIVLNGHALPTVNAFGVALYSTTVTVPAQWLVEGTNSLQFRSAGTGDFSFFDYAQVSYSRRFVADSNQIKAFSPNNKNVRVEGFSSANVRVFDITNDSEPVLSVGIPIVQNGATFTAAIPAGRGRLFYAVEDTALKSVQSVVSNDITLLGSPANGANLVIIAHKSMMATASAWAAYRRAQGISVIVAETSEVYDEFNYGVLSSGSITSFLQYAAANWQTAPGYVLLIGDASYDSRNYQGTGYWNMVPTKFVTTVYAEVGSDEAMVDFDGDGLTEMAIGRIPVRVPQEAADILARQITWEAALSPTPLSRRTVLAFDFPNTYDFEGMSDRIAAQLPAGSPVTKIARASPTAKADLITALNAGPYLVNYSGHGSTGVWAATSFFGNGDVAQLVNPPASRPVYTMLTCLNGYFMNLTTESLAEVLIKSSGGGAISAWASTGETTPDIQEVMALRFYHQIGSGPANMNRIGDLIRDAKTAVVGGSDVRLSWALIGDPMLKVR